MRTNFQKAIILTRIAVFAALICVAAPLSAPVNIIPITLATFAIYLTAGTLGARDGTAAVAVYILLGAFGLPVFSNFGAGFGKILGPTGGYIIGYLPLTLIAGFIADRANLKVWKYALGMVAATVVLYACGTVWFMLQTQRTLLDTLTVTALPFLPGDAIKIVAASALAPVLRTRTMPRGL